MRHRSDVIIAVVIAVIILPGVMWAQSAGYWLEKGIEYSSRGDYEKAIECDTKAIELAPDWAKAYYYRGIDSYSIGRLDNAVRDYTKAIELEPEYTDVYFNRGIVYDDMRRYGDAIDDYTKVIELDPEYIIAYNNRGWAFYLTSDYEKALKDVTYAIDHVDADDTYLLSGILDTRANIYRETGRYDEAMADIEHAIELEPDEYFFYHTRGMIHRDLGDAGRARVDLTTACNMGVEEACDALDRLRQ